jgi:hypothetical protein
MSNLLIREDLKFSEKTKVLKVYLYTKMIDKGLIPFDNDLNILSELYFFGGYKGDKYKKEFYKILLNKKLRGSEQSIHNKLTDFHELGLIKRTDKNCVDLNYDFFPEVLYDIKSIGLILKIHAN